MNEGQFFMEVQLKGLWFNVAYRIIETDEEGVFEPHLDSVKSGSDEMDLSYFEEEEIRESIRESHFFEQRKIAQQQEAN